MVQWLRGHSADRPQTGGVDEHFAEGAGWIEPLIPTRIPGGVEVDIMACPELAIERRSIECDDPWAA